MGRFFSRLGKFIEATSIWLLVPLGFWANRGAPDCDACAGVSRLLQPPGDLVMVGLHAVAAVAWLIHQRHRGRALRGPAEFSLLVALTAGTVGASVFCVQAFEAIMISIVFVVPGLFLFPAPISAWAFSSAISQRLHQLGVRRMYQLADAELPMHESRLQRWAREWGSWLGSGDELTPSEPTLLGHALAVVLGVLVLLEILGLEFTAAFTQTCGWTLSQRHAFAPDVCPGHYLCTVAANGHPRLVRPLRLGRRAGQLIVVNRQLAVANAFEDLLHERWPRFGRFARRTYDRVGFPICHWIRGPLAADLVYLAMLPAQFGFELALRCFDSDSEARVGRMYPLDPPPGPTDPTLTSTRPDA